MVEMLVHHGANVNAKDSVCHFIFFLVILCLICFVFDQRGWTPLIEAAHNGNRDNLDYLVQNGEMFFIQLMLTYFVFIVLLVLGVYRDKFLRMDGLHCMELHKKATFVLWST